MTKVLYWNIDDFHFNKIGDTRNKTEPGTSIAKKIAAPDRFRFIIDTIKANIPDIIVIVETDTDQGNQGTLIGTGGDTGSRLLLKRIRDTESLGEDWMLIPPLRLGQNNVQEGISVFFNSSKLIFSGPWNFRGSTIPSASTAPAPGLAYSDSWANCLPDTVVPLSPAGLINRGIPSNQLAGQWQYLKPVPIGPTELPIRFPTTNDRPPYLTTFWDTENSRPISLFSFHAATGDGAVTGTNQIARIPEVSSALVGNEARIIVGDFNVNLLDDTERNSAYGNLIAAGYALQIEPTLDQWPDKGYIGTNLLARIRATPWNTNGYPGYGYAGNSQGVVSVDNILTLGGNPANMTIANRVTGTPFNKVDPAPNNPPIGHYPFPTGMSPIVDGDAAGLPVALPLPPSGPASGGGFAPGADSSDEATNFRLWRNYGKIRSTSDHLALIIDI